MCHPAVALCRVMGVPGSVRTQGRQIHFVLKDGVEASGSPGFRQNPARRQEYPRHIAFVSE
jgi:acyl-coenzyme A synthetase/AMP-(fatty) acid ligase